MLLKITYTQKKEVDFFAKTVAKLYDVSRFQSPFFHLFDESTILSFIEFSGDGFYHCNTAVFKVDIVYP